MKIYAWFDAGAPTLTGQAGSLTNLLDKCLVDGYGSKISAGWDVAFSGTDKRVYRSPAVDGLRHFYRVEDDGSHTGGARAAYLRGFHDMSDVDTGVAPYPTVAQRSRGVTLDKSNTANATERGWYVVASDRFVALWTDIGANFGYIQAFGEFERVSDSDTEHALVAGSGTDGSGNAATTFGLNICNAPGTTAAGIHIAGDPTGVSLSISGGVGSGRVGPTNWGDWGSGSYPNPNTNSIVAVPIFVQSGGNVRGYVPGFFDSAHALGNQPARNTLISGSGMSFRMLGIGGQTTGEKKALFGWPS